MGFVTARSSRTELIGREREAEELNAHRRKAAEGHGRIVLVAGEAGIGKSRLLRHFTAGVSSGRAVLVQSRCVEFVQTPLGPLHDVLLQLERHVDAPRDAAVRSLIERLMFEQRADTIAPSPAGCSLFESVDAAFARCASRLTAVLLIEDIHWADRSTLAFLAYAAERIERRRMLIVATYRSDEIGAGHPALAEFAALLSRNAVSSITLARLSERATSALIEQGLPQNGSLSSATIADIARRSQGNPFFAEELLKSALDGYTGSCGEILPLSIRGAVLARAARLSQGDRQILSLAAVLGEHFSVHRLIALSDGDREAVLGALERARGLSLVYDEAGARGEVAFRHALTQEVLYGELIAERARPLHEAIALELESRSDRNAMSAELAHHWRRAGELQRAAAYDELAGDQAAAIGAFADAILYYERALGVRRDAPADLEHKLGVALGALNQLAAGIEHLRHAADLYLRCDDFDGFAKNASALGAQLYNSGNPEAATTVYRYAVETLEPKLGSDALNLLRARIAYNCVASLDFESARTFADELPETIAHPFVATNVYQTRSKVAAMRGEIDLWRRNAVAAVESARRIADDGASLRHAHTQAALDAIALGEIECAREHLTAALLVQRDGKSPLPLPLAVSSFEHTLRGDFATAAALLEAASSVSDQAYAIQVHVKSASFALGICSGDETRMRRDDAESFLRYGVNHGMKLAIGLLGGPYAWVLGLRGEVQESAAWISQIAAVLPGPHRFMFAYLAAAQFGNADDVRKMRQQLLAAARPQDPVNAAVRGLFDAFAAKRGIVKVDVRTSALGAGAAFEGIGWRWFAARSYELGGESGRALETYRSLGSSRDSRRLESETFGVSSSALSSREMEVAQLVSSGHSNEEIAQILHISPRTAEKHVSSALRKLNLRSRVQLGRVLTRSQHFTA
ncbi:MAG: AAA family ATPase [Candidatus Eremiobacteraeota bacterium]|nr:AAA family ATPase [Candidatus Eremiobacteraeota bacterium]